MVPRTFSSQIKKPPFTSFHNIWCLPLEALSPISVSKSAPGCPSPWVSSSSLFHWLLFSLRIWDRWLTSSVSPDARHFQGDCSFTARSNTQVLLPHSPVRPCSFITFSIGWKKPSSGKVKYASSVRSVFSDSLYRAGFKAILNEAGA